MSVYFSNNTCASRESSEHKNRCDASDTARIGVSEVKLNQFSSFLKTLLDDVKRYTFQQQRHLFRILFQATIVGQEHLVSHNDPSDKNIVMKRLDPASLLPSDDIMILLKKFAAFPDLR